MSDYNIDQWVEEDGTDVIEIVDGDGNPVYRQTFWSAEEGVPDMDTAIELMSGVVDMREVETAFGEIAEIISGAGEE